MLLEWTTIIMAAIWVLGTIQWLKQGSEKFLPAGKQIRGWVWWILSFGLSFLYGTVLYLAPKSAIIAIIGTGLSILSLTQLGWDALLKRAIGFAPEKSAGPAE